MTTAERRLKKPHLSVESHHATILQAPHNTDTLATPEQLEAEPEKADKEVNG